MINLLKLLYPITAVDDRWAVLFIIIKREIKIFYFFNGEKNCGNFALGKYTDLKLMFSYYANYLGLLRTTCTRSFRSILWPSMLFVRIFLLRSSLSRIPRALAMAKFKIRNSVKTRANWRKRVSFPSSYTTLRDMFS